MLASCRLRTIWAVWASIAIQLSITAGWQRTCRRDAAEIAAPAQLRPVGMVHLVEPSPARRVVVAVGGGMNLAGDRGQRRLDAGHRVGMAHHRASTSLPPGQFENSAISSGSRLWFLGDVFAVPHGWPFANVFSVGDVVIVVGLLVLVHRACRPSSRPRATADGARARAGAVATLSA